MLKYLNEILLPMRTCFTRQATFEWFVIIVVGFMLRSDHLGVTSIIRVLSLSSRCYETLIHLFGAIGILTGSSQKWFCLPLLMNLQDGVKAILTWKKTETDDSPSHVVQMIEQGVAAAQTFGHAFLLLDPTFRVKPSKRRNNSTDEEENSEKTPSKQKKATLISS